MISWKCSETPHHSVGSGLRAYLVIVQQKQRFIDQLNCAVKSEFLFVIHWSERKCIVTHAGSAGLPRKRYLYFFFKAIIESWTDIIRFQDRLPYLSISYFIDRSVFLLLFVRFCRKLLVTYLPTWVVASLTKNWPHIVLRFEKKHFVIILVSWQNLILDYLYYI